MLLTEDYQLWFNELKIFVKNSQIKAKLSVNSQMILMYRRLGLEISTKINSTDWGSKLIEQLSRDLKSEFPEIKGFSRTNLYSIKKFYEFYSDFEFVHQVGGQLTNKPPN